MFCKYCGKEIRDDAKFCSFCGENIHVKKRAEKLVSNESAPIRHIERNVKTWITLGIMGLLLIGAFIFLGNESSIQGKWYIVFEESYENPPESEFNFMENGTFIGDGNVGGTYGAENGELFLQYNPLAGSRSYAYEIKGGKLYLYRGEKVFVYTKTDNRTYNVIDIE